MVDDPRQTRALPRAFSGFYPEVVARFGDADVERLMADAGIVSNRAKIRATIGNARATFVLRDDGLSLAPNEALRRWWSRRQAHRDVTVAPQRP